MVNNTKYMREYRKKKRDLEIPVAIHFWNKWRSLVDGMEYEEVSYAIKKYKRAKNKDGTTQLRFQSMGRMQTGVYRKIEQDPLDELKIQVNADLKKDKS
jgi:hypothetical protein